MRLWVYSISASVIWETPLQRTFPTHPDVSLSTAAVSRAPSQYPKIRLFVRSRKVSKPREWYFKLSYRFEIWQAHRQQCCRSACQISERSDNSKYKSRGFVTSRDLTKRRLFGYWDGAQIPWSLEDARLLYFSMFYLKIWYASQAVRRAQCCRAALLLRRMSKFEAIK